MTRSGRAALAAAVMQQPLHLAWGSGSTEWEEAAPDYVGAFSAADVLQLPHAYIKDVVVTTSDDATTYIVSSDYTVDATTGCILRVVTGAIPSLGTVKVAYSRDTPPNDVTQEAMLNELGRRIVDEVAFVVADEEGAIVAPTGRFTLCAYPTNHLFVRVRFDFADAATSILREQGLFVGTVIKSGVPDGQKYFEPGDVTDPGILLIAQNTVPIIRQPSTRETFEFVVTF
jgi:acyl-coenzyme A thioesterase PaaI-like protein